MRRAGFIGKEQFGQMKRGAYFVNAAVNAIFMLQTNKIVAIEVEEISGTLIGGKVLLLYFKANLFRSDSVNRDR